MKKVVWHIVLTLFVLSVSPSAFASDLNMETMPFGFELPSHVDTPANVVASPGRFENMVRIQWDPVEKATGYSVFRARNMAGPYFPISPVLKSPTFDDPRSEIGKYYWYKVIAWRHIFFSKASTPAEGWAALFMPSGDESAVELLTRVIIDIPHFMRIKEAASKVEETLPEAMDVESLIPTGDEIFSYVENVCRTEHRRIGSPEAQIAEDYIIEEMGSILKPENVLVEEVACDVYKADHWKLEVEQDGVMEEFPAFYTVNTGIVYDGKPTGGSVSGEMIWAGEGTRAEFDKIGNIEGKIVVAQCTFPQFPVGLVQLLYSDGYYTSDPTNSFNLFTTQDLTFVRSNFPAEYTEENNPESVYWLASERGAAGLVLVLKDHPFDINTHWGPYAGKMKAMPCMYVSNYKNDDIKAVAERGAMAKVTIEGSLEPGVGRNICGILPGKSEETIIISTHHDSAFKGATEDGTGVGMVLAMAKTWSQVPPDQREKTLLFVTTTGHFYGGKGSRAFAHEHADDLLKNAILDINLEHLAARNYVDDGKGNGIFDGEQALSIIFVNEDYRAIATASRMMKENQPERTLLIPSTLLGPVPPGEAGHYHMYTGVDFIHWIGQPYYLLTSDDTLDKVDVSQLYPLAKSVSGMIGTYMNMDMDQ